MTTNLTESIFESKKNIYDEYRTKFKDASGFDLERGHLFYGRLDPDGDVMFLDEPSNLKQIYAGSKKTHFAVDFVCDAFSSMRNHIKKVADRGHLDRNGTYPLNLKVHKAWGQGDLGFFYNQYINRLYVDFVNNYLEIDRRHERITDHKTFIKEFLRYSLRNASYFPITKTGFIASMHCSPFASGLMVEIAPERHGLPTNTRILSYVRDKNYPFFDREVRKFGFMIDRNAPWRFVFNLASGWAGTATGAKPAGAQFFMGNYGINFENVFKFYYRKAHLAELTNITNLFYSLYDSFYKQYATYENITYHKDEHGDSRCNKIVVSSVRNNRRPPQEMIGEEYYEYWLKILLKLRFKETNYHHTSYNFNFFINELIDRKRLLGVESGLNYINELTKGVSVTTFNTRGKNWQGVSDQEYYKRLRQGLENAQDPSHVQYSLVGTKNIK